MLVLSRKATERIHVGNDIVVEVRRIAGNRVTLAIEAPKDIRILRGELEQIATEFEAGEAPPERKQDKQAYTVSHERVSFPKLHAPEAAMPGWVI